MGKIEKDRNGRRVSKICHGCGLPTGYYCDLPRSFGIWGAKPWERYLNGDDKLGAEDDICSICKLPIPPEEIAA